jgi:hypothetical protein
MLLRSVSYVQVFGGVNGAGKVFYGKLFIPSFKKFVHLMSVKLSENETRNIQADAEIFILIAVCKISPW